MNPRQTSNIDGGTSTYLGPGLGSKGSTSGPAAAFCRSVLLSMDAV